MTFDATEAAEHLKPEAAARLREIVRTCMELQSEAADIMADESARLSSTRAEEEAARLAIGTWYGRLAFATMSDAAEESQRPAS